MTDDLDLLALAEKSAENDLAFLIRAKEDTKRLMKQSPTQDNIAAFKRAKAAVADEVARLQQGGGTSMRVFKTQLDAAAFLRDQGFKISKSQFNRDVQARKVAKNADGNFEEGALMGYAAAHLDPIAQAENRALSDATVGRLTADAELKRYTAERARLKLAKEQGELMPRAEHEEELSARALFFKSEIESFGFRKAGEIIALVHGDESKLPELMRWWDDNTADWMDAWAQDRDFGTAVDDLPEQPLPPESDGEA